MITPRWDSRPDWTGSRVLGRSGEGEVVAEQQRRAKVRADREARDAEQRTKVRRLLADIGHEGLDEMRRESLRRNRH